MADRTPPLGVEELHALVASGEIDTVVLAFPDMQGRLQGKRFAARFFLDEVLQHGTEGCNYLLAVDTEMNTVDGYAMSSWDRGYGDFAMHPDLSTLRRVPWNAGTAMLIADLAWNDGSPGRRRPPPDPAPPAGAPRRARLHRAGRHRAGVHRLQGHLRAGLGRQLPRAHPGQPVQHRLLGARHRPRRAPAAPHPQRDGRRRPAPSSPPRASATPASTRSPSATTRPWSPATSTPSTRPAPRRSPPRRACPSPSWPSTTSARATPATSTSRSRDAAGNNAMAGDGRGRHVATSCGTSSPDSSPPSASSRCSTPPTSTPTSGSSRAPSPRPPSPGATTTAPARCASSATAAPLRFENRLPGGDVNPYLAVAGTGRGRAVRHRAEAGAARGVPGQRLQRRRTRTSRPPCARPPTSGRTAPSPRPPSVTRSSRTTATWRSVELEAFDAAVTDWELRRSFERL